ncbi:lumazine synthase [Geranomyces variabilis]|uniref:6,7-dimethyl-8-ribityllumazine synthase n=1 Tax=Geranomyces variabilis TaxID=109894 RepID=A0AAD5TIK9_9FUNG|nr:lumazine synthase [Geranomyces variabilis]
MKDFEKGLVARTEPADGKGLRILIVHTRWNAPIVNALVEGATAALRAAGVAEITTRDVPGCYELPLATASLLAQQPYDAAISIGVLIKGSTMHFEYIADAASHGLMRVGLDAKRPVIFGILTCLTEDQAKERAGIAGAGDEGHNHGRDWGLAAVEMARLNNGQA